MRLINVETLELEEFIGENRPRYAILSHTWEEGQEVSYEEWLQPEVAKRKKGYAKIERTCRIAKEKFQLQYVWVDTNCIDKRSSADLSECINSMYRWYEKSAVCIVYLADVVCPHPWIYEEQDGQDIHRQFDNSRWFARGWTLQELIAPREHFFFSSEWVQIPSRFTSAETISKITTIPIAVLDRTGPFVPSNYTIAARMQWASRRKTTRVEDIAYCLLGLFGINMPLLYGEGSKAFQRLQEEIIKVSTDLSILAWNLYDNPRTNAFQPSHKLGEQISLLAPTPSHFNCNVPSRRPQSLVHHDSSGQLHYSMTNAGLQLRTIVLPTQTPSFFILPLDLGNSLPQGVRVFWSIIIWSRDHLRFERTRTFPRPVPIELRGLESKQEREIYLTAGQYCGDIPVTIPSNTRCALVTVMGRAEIMGALECEREHKSWQFGPVEPARGHPGLMLLKQSDDPTLHHRILVVRALVTGPRNMILVLVRCKILGGRSIWDARILTKVPKPQDSYEELYTITMGGDVGKPPYVTVQCLDLVGSGSDSKEALVTMVCPDGDAIEKVVKNYHKIDRLFHRFGGI